MPKKTVEFSEDQINKLKTAHALAVYIICPEFGIVLDTTKGDDKADCYRCNDTHRVANCRKATDREILDQFYRK